MLFGVPLAPPAAADSWTDPSGNMNPPVVDWIGPVASRATPEFGLSVSVFPRKAEAVTNPAIVSDPDAKPPLASRWTSVLGVFTLVPLAAAGALGSHVVVATLNVSTLPSVGAVLETARPWSRATAGFG